MAVIVAADRDRDRLWEAPDTGQGAMAVLRPSEGRDVSPVDNDRTGETMEVRGAGDRDGNRVVDPYGETHALALASILLLTLAGVGVFGFACTLTLARLKRFRED